MHLCGGKNTRCTLLGWDSSLPRAVGVPKSDIPEFLGEQAPPGAVCSSTRELQVMLGEERAEPLPPQAGGKRPGNFGEFYKENGVFG